MLCVAVYWITARLRAGPTAIAALARRDDPELATSLGVGHRQPLLLAGAGAAGAAAGAGIALTLGVAAPADLSPLLALQLLAAAIAGTRYPLIGAAVIVALAHAPAELTAVLLLAAVALRRVLPERIGSMTSHADGGAAGHDRVARGPRPASLARRARRAPRA